MTKGSMADEVSILRFFEDGPIAKAEVVFNIVTAKMRDRLSANGEEGDGEHRPSAETQPVRKRGTRASADMTREVTETKN